MSLRLSVVEPTCHRLYERSLTGGSVIGAFWAFVHAACAAYVVARIYGALAARFR